MATNTTKTRRTSRVAKSNEIRLDDIATTQAVKLPSSWDKVRAFAEANVVTPVKTGTTKAYQKTKETVNKGRNLHAVSTKDATVQAYEVTERISSETFGAFSGALKGLTATAIGATGGLLAGIKGISPAVVKRLRLAADEEAFTLMGTWDAIRPQDNDLRVRMSLTTDPRTGEEIDPTIFSTSISKRYDDVLVIEGRRRHCILLPYALSETHEGFWIVVNDPELRNVYLWLDA